MSETQNSSVRIVQVDGKDLYLTNTLLDEEKIGYQVWPRKHKAFSCKP